MPLPDTAYRLKQFAIDLTEFIEDDEYMRTQYSEYITRASDCIKGLEEQIATQAETIRKLQERK